MMKRLLLAVALAGALTSPSLADFHDGNSLLSLCTAAPNHACLGYVEGIADAWDTLQGWEPSIRRCKIPENVTAGQARDVVLQYLQQHPKERHLSAASQALNALGQAFCS